ncbi:flagellar basal body-associated protein FliL [Gallaecimonas sp. GXIMD4217]|uniref:flagellar basal body-associated protein FliL n=1 Tax=Gallaecimonas sp. GXIMD4217 TaxID=3131927 RepID=UPI00311B1058
MAEELELEAVEQGGKRKTWLLIGAISGLVLVVAGVLAYFLWPAQEQVEQTQVAEVAEAAVGEALYVGMPRPFVLNVPGNSRDRLVQIKVQLMVRGRLNENKVKQHIPLIEGTLLSAFSQKTAEELSTLEGRELLREQSLKDVVAALEPVAGANVVERVLFTGFVMQ